MSAVVYKQPFNKPTHAETPNKNAEHIRYIGTRPGVMKNEGQKHGLFGNIYNPETLEINTKVNDVMELVRRKSYEKKNIFKSVISFAPENALLKVGNPVTKEAWEELVKQQLRIIAEGNGIKMSNFRWVAAAHDKHENPHVHIVFWDESQEIVKNKVDSQIPNGIRKNLIKNIFEDELKAYHEERDHCEWLMKDITESMVKEFEDYLKNMSVREYKHFKDTEYFDEDSPLPEFLAARLYELRKEIPKGSLKYAYQAPEVKEKVLLLVRELMDMDEGLKEAVLAYVDVKLKEAGLYQDINKNLDALTGQYMKKAEVDIANIILKYITKFSKKDKEVFSHDREIYQAKQLLNEIFKLLGRSSSSRKHSAQSRRHIMGGGLSKQARKEKAKELSDTGWELDK
jgi:hypothetical protein